MFAFAFPALLVGAAAAGLPWLIHMILRPRPARVRFPAVSLLHSVLVAGRRASKLRNLWLLMIRTLAVALLAFLLAGPTCRTRGGAVDQTGPVAGVIVFDDSLSMTYRLDERTLAQIAEDQLSQLLSEPQALKSASDWGIVFAGDDGPPPPFSPEIGDVARQFYSHAATPHARPLGEAMRRAAAMFSQAPQSRKHLYVFTDLSSHAWRDVPRGILSDVPGVQVTIIAATQEPRPNIAIRRVEGAERIHAASTPVVLRASASAYGAPARCRIIVQQTGAVVARSPMSTVSADASLEIGLSLPPMPHGPHGITLSLEPDDRLSFDRTRFVAVQSGLRPAALMLVSDPSDAAADLTAMIVSNLISPAALDDAMQPVEFNVVTPATLEDALKRETNLLIIPGDVALSGKSERDLLSAVQRGAQVILLPTSKDPAVITPAFRPLFSASAFRVRDGGVTTMTWEPASPLSDSDEGLAEFVRCAVRRRLIVDQPPADVVVHARYADGSPALLSRDRGDGTIWLLTTSPDPQWSDLGTRAAGMLTFFFRLIDRSAGPAGAVADFVVGQQSRRSFAGLRSDGLVRVSRRTDASIPATWVRLAGGVPDRDWPTDSPGLYGIHSTGRAEPAAVYSVNWPAAESDTTPITLDEISAILGTGDVIELLDSQSGRGDRDSAIARLSKLVPPEPAAAVLIVLLFAVELLIGNRVRHTAGADA